MATGTIKWFNTRKGFGFIQNDAGGKDVFLHISALEESGIESLNEGGIIFMDDVLPGNEREQHKIPIKHIYENGILKYKEPWTGDVWKVIYYLIKNNKEKLNFEIFIHPNYRGVVKFEFNEKVKISPEAINEIENYTYEKDFEEYFDLIMSNKKKA